MAEHDILGISATADFSDAFANIEKFCNVLASLGVISSDTSKRLQQSFAEIGAASTNELGAKTKAALQELGNALDETKKKVSEMPNEIQEADKKVEQSRKAIARLEDELSKLQEKQTKTPISSKQFQELGKQVEGVQSQLRSNRSALTLAEADASKLRIQYAKAQEALQSLQKMQEYGAATGNVNVSVSEIAVAAGKSATEINRMEKAFDEASSKAANTAESTQKVGEAASSAQKEVDGLNVLFDKLEKAGAAMGVGFSVKELGSKILNVRGEFQQLEVAFRTMIGNEKQAKDLFDQLVQTAAVTPFGLTDIANGAKQLLAFGLEADKVNDTLVRLGDIAAGLSIPLDDLIYLYGTTMTQGTLYTQDLRQFMGRGIPLADELAKQFGVTKDAVSQLVSEGKVGFPEVQTAIENLTNEGGKFGGLMDAQSHTITGQISNIEDALEGMFNDIGKSSEGVINKGLGVVSSLVENWRTVGKVLTDVVIVYGTYKAAVIACNAIRAIENGITGQAAVLKALDATATANLSHAELMAAARKQWLAGVTKSFIATLKAETAALLSNPYAIAAAALVGFGLVLYNVIKNQKDYVSETEQLQKAHNKMAADIKAQDGEIEASVNHSTASAVTKIEQLKRTIHDNNKTLKERKDAINELKKIVPGYHAQISQAGKLFNENSIAIDNYVKNLQKAARAEAAYSKMVENQRKILDLEDTRDDARQKQHNVNNAANRRGLKKGERVESRTQYVGTSSAGVVQTNTYYVIVDKNGKERGISNEQGRKLMQDADWGQMFDTRAKIANDGIKQLQQQNDKLQKTIDANGGFKPQSPTAGAGKVTSKTGTGKVGHSGGGSNDNYDPLQNAYETSKAKQEYEQYRQELANKLYDSVTANSIDMLTDEGEQQRKQIERNRTKDIAELDKMIEELAKRKQSLDKQEWLKGGKNRKEYQYANTANGKRTLQSYIDEVKQGEMLNAYNDSKESINAKYDAQLQAMLQKEQQEQQDALNAFYMKYGTAQQKEAAMRSQFASKIAKAKTVGEAKSLQKELETSLSELWTQTFADSIDWDTIFSNLNDLSKEQLTDLRNKITAYIKTDKFKKATPENQKVVTEALGEINTQLVQNGGLFANLSQTTKDYKKALKEYKQAQTELADALKELADATVSGDVDAINAANEKVTAARNNVADKKGNVTQTQQTRDKAEKKTIDNILSLSSAITKLGESSEMSLGEIGSVAEQVINVFSKAGSKIGGIVGAIFSILDAIQKVGLDGFVKNVFSSVFGAVGGIFHTLTGSSLFGSNEKSIDKTINNLTTSNQNLENAINTLTKKMEEAAAQDATNIYNRTKADVENEMQNTQKMMQEAGRAYSNGFLGIGGKHSSSKHINDAMSAQDWARISDIVGHTVSSAQDFFNLSSEQMEKVATNATDLYTKIQNAAKEGKKDVSSFMDSYIKYYQQLIDLQNAYNETLTGISFDNLKDELKSLLTDTETTMTDVSKKVADYMRSSIAKNILNSALMKQTMQKWYDDFAKYSGDSNGLTDTEAKDLQQRYTDIFTQLQKQYKDALKAAGIDEASSSEQTATAKGVSSITYDQANLLTNLATARNIALEKILAANTDILGIMRNGTTSTTLVAHPNGENGKSSLSVDYSPYLSNMTFDIGNIKEFSRTMSSDISVMRDIQEQGLNQLTKIEQNTRPLSDMRDDLSELKKIVKDNS